MPAIVREEFRVRQLYERDAYRWITKNYMRAFGKTNSSTQLDKGKVDAKQNLNPQL